MCIILLKYKPANTRYSANAGLMFVQRRRRWTNIMHGMTWHGRAHGMACHGMLWYSMAWHGMVMHDRSLSLQYQDWRHNLGLQIPLMICLSLLQQYLYMSYSREITLRSRRNHGYTSDLVHISAVDEISSILIFPSSNIHYKPPPWS